MPDIRRKVPSIKSYRYVLARWDWPRTQTYLAANYGETKKSVVVPWPEDWDLPRKNGVNAPSEENRDVNMVFVVDRHLRDRCIALGWHDITARWFERLGMPDGPNPVEVLDGLAVDEVATVDPGSSRPRGQHAPEGDEAAD